MTTARLDTELYIGLMSGTSLDGIDGVLMACTGDQFAVQHHAYRPFADALRTEFLALNSSGPNEIHRAALAGNALSRAYAEVVSELLQRSGVLPHQVVAIGAHGQTVRHRPQEFDVVVGIAVSPSQPMHRSGGYTVQVNNPALLAELTTIDVVADFRSRDVAAGGQGAPLVPAFHQAAFARANDAVAVLNIGGISNITFLEPLSTVGCVDVLGFDCGPGNALMDHWCKTHTGDAFDSDGRWAASGQVIEPLLALLRDDPYFQKTPPKSTGRDLFNPVWLEARLAHFESLRPVDVQATLTELTASACVDCVVRYGNQSVSLVVCGGGALNVHLMDRLRARWQARRPATLPAAQVMSSSTLGLPPLQVEAAAFAWLARKAIHRETGSLPKVTGAQGARILGAIYPA